jgi:hypothetical protein
MAGMIPGWRRAWPRRHRTAASSFFAEGEWYQNMWLHLEGSHVDDAAVHLLSGDDSCRPRTRCSNSFIRHAQTPKAGGRRLDDLDRRR